MFRAIVCWFLLCGIGLATGCATNREYVKVRWNHEVVKDFRSGKLQPQYRYYYTGPAGEPIALLALDRKYTLMSMFWDEFTTDFQLRDWIKGFDQVWGQFDDVEYVTIIYRGSEVLAPDGRRIGMIYSKYYWIVGWWGEKPNEIYITQPEPGGTQRAPFFQHRKWGSDR